MKFIHFFSVNRSNFYCNLNQYISCSLHNTLQSNVHYIWMIDQLNSFHQWFEYTDVFNGIDERFRLDLYLAYKTMRTGCIGFVLQQKRICVCSINVYPYLLKIHFDPLFPNCTNVLKANYLLKKNVFIHLHWFLLVKCVSFHIFHKFI